MGIREGRRELRRWQQRGVHDQGFQCHPAQFNAECTPRPAWMQNQHLFPEFLPNQPYRFGEVGVIRHDHRRLVIVVKGIDDAASLSDNRSTG